MTIRQAVQYGIKKLSKGSELYEKTCSSDVKPFIFSPTPALDTNCILEHILQKSQTFLLVHCGAELSSDEQKQFESALVLRRTGLPVAYITGHKEFYGLDFLVTPDVLIPKPDTELLVEHAVSAASGILAGGQAAPYRIADICTGSGCIAVSVLHEILRDPQIPENNKKSVSMTAADISRTALSVAQKNARNLLYPDATISFFQGDLLNAVPETGQFNMILSNPPYIPADEVTELLKDGRSEPRLALDGDTDSAISAATPAGSSSVPGSISAAHDGLAIIRRLIPQAYQRLLSGGIFLIETGEYNAEKTAGLMKKAGFTDVQIFKDLAGQLRLTQGRKSAVTQK